MGDILVFFTGQDDIDTAIRLLNEEAQSSGRNSSGLSDGNYMLTYCLINFYI